jgi:hypothetical protein
LIFGEGSLTRKRCKEASALVLPEWQQFLDEVASAKSLLEEVEQDLSTLEQDLALFDEEVLS